MRQAIKLDYPENLLCSIYLTNNFEEIKTDDDRSVVFARMTEMMDKLSEREKHVLLCRFQKRMTLAQTGDTLGVCKERTRQILNKALRKLRHPKYSKYILTGENEGKSLKAYIEEKCEASDLYQVGIDELGLSVRTYNCLRRAGYNSIADIIINEKNLVKIRNAGEKTILEIKGKIAPYKAMLSSDE